MPKIAVVTDSAANLPNELTERHRIFVVPVLLYIKEREYRDGIDLSPSDVYRYLLQSKDGDLPKTSTPSVGEFLRVYTMAAQEADEIVSIHLSSKLSAIYQAACTAREMVPAKIHVLDSRTAAMGCGFAVLEAARLAETGADAEAVIQRAQQISAKVRVLATLERLDYLHRGGHVPAVAAVAGSALKICPIITVEDGEARLIELPRTRRRAVRRMVELLAQDVGSRPVHIAVMHAAALSEAEQLHSELLAKFHCVESYITEFTPVMGTHTGPGLLGLSYYAEEEQTNL